LEKVKFFIKPFGKKALLVIFTSILLLTTALSEGTRPQSGESGKQKIVRQVAQRWIQVGMKQYERGFFRAAEQSFLRARDYEEYLTVGERERLNKLLEKTHTAAIERERVSEHVRTADKLVEQGELIKAKSHLEKVRDSEFSTKRQRELAVEGLKEIENQLKEQKRQVAKLYERSVELYQDGQLEKAREGFVKVAASGLVIAPAEKTAEDYLAKIDDILAQKPEAAVIKVPEVDKSALEILEDEFPGVEAEPVAVPEDKVIEQAEPETVQEMPEPVTEESSYIKVVRRRRNILRSHTRAIVNDAVAKAQSYISQGKFDEAKEAVETAERHVNKNRLHLGDDLFNRYSGELKQLAEKIEQGQRERAARLEKQKRVEAIEAQHQYREQTEINRQKRIIELMNNAKAYQKQQRYEEALGQLESLLALDPLNDDALILKDTLEDTISFRKQLEVQKETNKERADLLQRTDESEIPYAEEIVYPKNWREIAAKRKPEEAIGQDPANMAVYEQLDEIVDLSELTPEMSLSTAIEILKNSVDPPLKVFVNWRDLLENADIEQTTPINMDPISAIPLNRGLKFLLEAISGVGVELGYAVEDGIVTIATIEALPSEWEELVYDVTDLLGQPADYRASFRGGRGGGAGGVSDVGGGFQQQTEEDELERDELAERAGERTESLVLLIQETVEPDSWWEAGGEGTITIYQNRKLIVRQTREVHKKIEKLLKEMRKSLGYQVAIEARFLLVGEHFLEDVGLDVDFVYNPGGKWSPIHFLQGSSSTATPVETAIPGSLGAVGSSITIGGPFGLAGSYGTILDDLQVSFLLRATEAHRDSTALTAPKVCVLSGESASLQIERFFFYAGDVEPEIAEAAGEAARAFTTVNYEERSVTSGTRFNITPTITPDKKYVLLNIGVQLSDFLGFKARTIDLGMFGDGVGGSYEIEFPETEVSRVQTRVSVPDGGTLLLGGQKLTGQVETEAGVPILSKIPILGRLFTNRSRIEDNRILLILVKPTILLQEEREAEAVAAMESKF